MDIHIKVKEKEVIEELSNKNNPVSLDFIVEETSLEDRRQAKYILRNLLNKGKLKTVPGFKYKLKKS